MNDRVAAFMYPYSTCFEGYSAARARSPIFDTWQPEAQWRALPDLDAASLDPAVNRNG